MTASASDQATARAVVVSARAAVDVHPGDRVRAEISGPGGVCVSFEVGQG